MSLSGLFDIGRSALLANQAALSVVNNNVANVNTPGYSRKDFILEISAPISSSGFLIGSGVRMAGIKRHYDRFIQGQLLGQNQSQGRASALEAAYSEIEQVFNETGNLGLSRAVSDFFNAWSELSSNPESQPHRIQLLQKADSLVRSASSVERGITDTLKHINDEISGVVAQINDIAGSIAKLNDQIIKGEAGESLETAVDLRDQRDKLLNDLGNLVELSSYENSDGSINITVGMQNLVSGIEKNSFSAKLGRDGIYDFYLDGIDVTSGITKGKLGGFLAAQQDIIAEPLTDFRRFIASLVKEVNLQHQAGFGLDSSTGNDFFNSLQLSYNDYSSGADITSASITSMNMLTLDEYNITFDAANNYTVTNAESGSIVASGAFVSGSPIAFDGIEITITGTVAANDRFFVSPLTDAVRNFGVSITDNRQIAASASAAGLPGDGGNALLISRLTETAISDIGSSFSDYYSSIVSYTGAAGRAAADSLSFENNIMSELNNRRESISGVNLDEEAVNLIRFQRAYEAGARIIKVTDELMQTILQL